MSTKDTVVGTAKQIVAEIVGDGRLAEEGARQTHESDRRSSPDIDPDRPSPANTARRRHPPFPTR